MTRILVSTSARNTPIDQPSGELVVFELETQKIIRRCEMIKPPYTEIDPNPRGGLRGLKGISIQDDKIAIANTSTIFLYDAEWNPIRYFWHPSCSMIHDIAFHEDMLWASSAENDVVAGFSHSGDLKEIINVRFFSPLNDESDWNPILPLTTEQLKKGQIDFRNPTSHSSAYSDSAHVNGLAFRANGELLISCGLLKSQSHMNLVNLKNKLIRIGVWQKIIQFNAMLKKRIYKKSEVNTQKLVVHPTPGSSAVIRVSNNKFFGVSQFIPNVTFPSHSVKVLEDGTATYLVSATGELVHFDPESGKTLSTFKLGKSFLRGTEQLPDGTLLLGDHTRVYQFDLKRREIITSIQITDNSSHFVFSICTLPQNFSLPPKSFVELHERKLPVLQT